MIDKIQSLRRRLTETEENLLLIQERKSEYVEPTDVPLQLVKEERQREAEIADLQALLTRLEEIPCPYRGLDAFEEQHAEYYFGRDAMLARLVEKLDQSSLLFVIGSSGCGKSSLVRAGLTKAINDGKLPNDQTRVIRVLRPGHDPLLVLSHRFLALLHPEISDHERMTEAKAWASSLRNGELSLLDISILLRDKLPDPCTLILVVDRFEDLYIADCDVASCRAFVHALVTASEMEWMKVILAVRADSYGWVLEDPLLAQHLDAGSLSVLPMSDVERESAITEPVRDTGVSFEPGLVQRLKDDLSNTSGDLPLMQFALMELWREQTPDGLMVNDAYDAMGGVKGAVARRAEATYLELEREGYGELVRRIFLRLCYHGSGTRRVGRQVSQEELMPQHIPSEEAGKVAEKLANARLITIDWDEIEGKPVVELAHEVLISSWGRLKRWLDDDQEFLLWRQRLGERLREWQDRDRAKGTFLEGILLAEAQRWMGERSDDLNSDELNYIQESVISHEHTERQWQELYHIAKAHELAARAGLVQGSSGRSCICSALLSIESLRHFPTLDTDQVLRRLLSTLLPPIACIKHEEQALAVTFSPDANFLATRCGRTARIWDAVERQEIARLDHKASVLAMAFNSDSQMLMTVSSNGEITIWKSTDECKVTQIVHREEMLVAAFSANGKLLAVGSVDNTVGIWDLSSELEITSVSHESILQAIAFSPDSAFLVTGSVDGTARVWETATGQEVCRLEHEDWVLGVAFSSGGRWLATVSNDHTIEVWEVSTWRHELQVRHEAMVRAVAFSPDDRWLVTAAEDGEVKLQTWDVSAWRYSQRMMHDGAVLAVAFSPDSRQLAIADGEGKVQLWQVDTWREVAEVLHEEAVAAVVFSPDGKLLATGSADKTTRVWETTIKHDEAIELAHISEVNAVAFRPDGLWLATGSKDGITRLWEVGTWRKLSQVMQKEAIMAVAFSPNGDLLATVSGDKTARVWDVAGGNDKVAEPAHWDNVNAIAFSPDERWLATGSEDGMVSVWEITNGNTVAQMSYGNSIEAVTFSPDGKWFAMGCSDNSIRVWETATWHEVIQVTHDDKADALVFSPDGRWLVSGSSDKTARIWEIPIGREDARMTTMDKVNDVAISPDGHWLATAGDDGAVRVWSIGIGREVGRMMHSERVNALTFSPDGRWLVTGSADNTARVWLWRTEDLIAEICSRLPRNLTHREWQQYLGDEPYHPTCPED